MIRVQFPPTRFRMKKRGEKTYVFDTIRKAWLLLTEEEWVRQNLVAYLVTTLQYPKEVIALEKGLVWNGMKMRFDILLYNREHQPWMIIECKAPQVNLNEAVLQQAMRYNLVVPAQWIVVTNGDATYVWKKEAHSLQPVAGFPTWPE